MPRKLGDPRLHFRRIETPLSDAPVLDPPQHDGRWHDEFRPRHYRRRVGAWETLDGRYELRWFSQRAGLSRAYPDGALRLYDREHEYSTWHYNLRAARAEIARRLGVEDEQMRVARRAGACRTCGRDCDCAPTQGAGSSSGSGSKSSKSSRSRRSTS